MTTVMELVARAGMGFFLVVTMWVGLRLVALGIRSGELPEWVIGTAYLSIGSGSVLVVVGGGLHVDQPDLGVRVQQAGALLTSLGSCALLHGCWRIFRSASRVAAGIAGAGIFALVATVAVVMSGDAGQVPTRTMAYWSGFAIRIATFAWIGGESLRYYGLLHRRLALGLTTPVMAHRFLLWGVAAVTTTFSYLVYLGFEVGGSSSGESAGATGLLGLLGASTGLCLWLAFFPPDRYRRWVEERFAAAAAADA